MRESRIMNRSIDCCRNCALALNLEQYAYGAAGVEHKDMPGFICLAFRDEGVAIWMTGIDKDKGRCECYRPKGEKYA